MNVNNTEINWLLSPESIPSDKLIDMYKTYTSGDITCMYNMVLQKANYCRSRTNIFPDDELIKKYNEVSVSDRCSANYIVELCYKFGLYNECFDENNKLLSDIVELLLTSVVFDKQDLLNDVDCKIQEYIKTCLMANDVCNNDVTLVEAMFKGIVPISVCLDGKLHHPLANAETFVDLIRNFDVFINKVFTQFASNYKLEYIKNLPIDDIIAGKFPNGKALVLFTYMITKSIEIELCFLDDLFSIIDHIIDVMLDDEESMVPFITSVRKMIDILSKSSCNDDCGSIAVATVSSEGIQGTTFNVTKKDAGSLQGAKAEDITEKYKSRSLKLKKLFIDTFKVGPTLRKLNKNAKFFNKYFGRIPGLYKQYANEAYVYENKMKDDPAQVLSTKAVKFISDMAQFTDVTFGELVNMSQKIASSSSSVQRIGLVKGYCKHYPIDTADDPKLIYNQIENETYYRIASAILKNIEIYGYTVEGIVQNKEFPSANHIVVSMFIDNPNETPEKQPVSQVFRKPESMLVFSKPENFRKFTNLYSATSSKILGDFDSKSLGNVSEMMKASSDRIIQGIKNEDNVTFAEQSDPKLQKAIVKAIEKAVVHSVDIIVDQKQRVLQCASAAFQMVERISKTAQMCVVAMLEVERGKVDSTYVDKQQGQVSRSQQKAFDRNRRHVEGNEGRPQAKKYKATLFDF